MSQLCDSVGQGNEDKYPRGKATTTLGVVERGGQGHILWGSQWGGCYSAQCMYIQYHVCISWSHRMTW